MLTPAMLRILRWLDEHPTTLESAWDVPRTISLEGIADGIGVVRSALFQPMSVLEDNGFLQTRQAHVLGSGRRKRKVVHITEKGRQQLREQVENLPERRSRESLKLKGQIPECTNLHGRQSELELMKKSLEQKRPIHLRGMPGIGKSTLARTMVQELAERGTEIHWAVLDAYCDVHEAMQRMEFDSPRILEVEHYANIFETENVVLVFDDVHTISSRHKSSFLSFFQTLLNNNIAFMLIGRDRETFPIETTVVDLGPLDQSDAIELLDPELGENRASIVEALGGHPLAILLYNASTPLPETDQDVRAYVEQVVLEHASTDVHDAMQPFLVLPFPIPAMRMPEPDHVPLLDEHTLLRWGAQNSAMEMQHLIRNVCRSSLEESDIDALHQSAISHWENDDDALAKILELHHRIQRGETNVSAHLSQRANELMNAHSGAFATLLDEALVNENENLELIELAAQHALNRAELNTAKEYIKEFDDPRLANIRFQIAQYEGKNDVVQHLESLTDGIDDPNQKLRIQLSVLSRSIDDLTPQATEDDHRRIHGLLERVDLPDKEGERQRILTTIVVMRHALALEQRDFNAANFLLDQLKNIALTDDPLLHYLSTKTELKMLEKGSADAAFTLKNAERIATQLKHPLYKVSVFLLLCEHLVETQPQRAQLLHEQIDIQAIETMTAPSARRIVAKWWEVKSMVDEKGRILALREAILRYRSVGCPNRARRLSKRLHSL